MKSDDAVWRMIRSGSLTGWYRLNNLIGRMELGARIADDDMRWLLELLKRLARGEDIRSEVPVPKRNRGRPSSVDLRARNILIAFEYKLARDANEKSAAIALRLAKQHRIRGKNEGSMIAIIERIARETMRELIKENIK